NSNWSAGSSLNSRGVFTGTSYATDNTQHSFVSYQGATTDLTALAAFSLDGRTTLNESGVIAGSVLVGSASVAAMLVPVPEPSTYALMLLGLAGLALYKRRAQHITGQKRV
ncbi:MAG: PEP-CTERM sorting domain-containing protein, partial [Pseudomonadota bacterium]|nr:PEP-CTERM sorting domain-containing protein [Pseudomonadota bacterium]